VLAQAALNTFSRKTPDPWWPTVQEIKQIKQMFRGFYSDYSDFEKSILYHRVFRHRVASLLARRQGRSFVPALDLFAGSICKTDFTTMRFAVQDQPRLISAAPAAGNWCVDSDLCGGKQSRDVPTSIKLQDQTEVNLFSATPYAVLLSGKNAFDGIFNDNIITNSSWDGQTAPQTKPAQMIIDCKFTQYGLEESLNYKTDVVPLLANRQGLACRLPDFEHILAVVTNRHTRRAGGKSHTAESFKVDSRTEDTPGMDSNTCIMSATDDGLVWGLSPTFAGLMKLGKYDL